MDCTLAAEGLAKNARSSSRLGAWEGGGWGKLQIFVSVNMSIKGLYLIVSNLKFRKYLISRFWRENISRGFIFAISTRKYERRTLTTQHFSPFF